MFRRSSHPSLRAFTLIEVLVVVAIIGLLISILLPSLAAVRYQAWTTACASNLHQCGIGINTFASEQKDWVPRGASPRTRFTWVQLIARMFGDKNQYSYNYNLVPVEKMDVLHCPTRSRTTRIPFLDYVVNAMDHRGPLDAAGQPSASGGWLAVEGVTKRSLWKHPATVIYLMDAAKPEENPSNELVEVQQKIAELRNPKINIPSNILPPSPFGWGRFDVYMPLTLPAYPQDTPVDCQQKGKSRASLKMHGKGSNALFVDGHAGLVTPPLRKDDPLAVAQSYMVKFGVLDAIQKNFPVADALGDAQYKLGNEDYMPF